jgi:hypothetical protein
MANLISSDKMQEALTAEKETKYNNGPAYIRQTTQPKTNRPKKPPNNEAKLYKLKEAPAKLSLTT